MTTEAEKLRGLPVKDCQINPTAQAVPCQGWKQGAAIAIYPLTPEGSGALWKFEASVVRLGRNSSQYAGVHRRDSIREPVELVLSCRKRKTKASISS